MREKEGGKDNKIGKRELGEEASCGDEGSDKELPYRCGVLSEELLMNSEDSLHKAKTEEGDNKTREKQEGDKDRMQREGGGKDDDKSK